MRISDWSSDVCSSDLEVVLKKCRCRPFSGQRVVLHHGNYLMEQAGGVARVGGGRPILSVGFQPYNSVAAPREHGLNQFFALEPLSSFARERVSCGSPNLRMLRCCRSQPLQPTPPFEIGRAPVLTPVTTS